jgi:hypothetical protein
MQLKRENVKNTKFKNNQCYATGNPYPVEFLQASSKIDLAVGYEHQPIDQHNQNPAHSQFRNIAEVS